MFCLSRIAIGAVTSVAVFPLVLCAQASKPDAKAEPSKNDPKIVEQIKGDYVLKAGTIDGNKMTADRIANVSVKITDQTITTYDGQREQRFSAAYKILNDKRPWHITLKSVKKVSTGDGKTKEKIEQSEGIIDVSEDGARLQLAYAIDATERPKDFKGGKQQNVFEVERLKTPIPKVKTEEP